MIYFILCHVMFYVKLCSISSTNSFPMLHNFISGEGGSVDEDQLEHWFSTELQEILLFFDPARILNSDETGVGWRSLGKKTLVFRKKKTEHGSKAHKERFTCMLTCSASGRMYPPLMIGTAK